MPDITMCKDADCKMSHNCIRYTSTPDKLQAWYLQSPRRGQGCNAYWPETRGLGLEKLKKKN